MTYADQTDHDLVLNSASLPAARCWPTTPITVPVARRRPALGRLVPDEQDRVADEQARRFVAGLCRGILEVLDGRRSCAQLTRWCCPEVLTTIEVWQQAGNGRRLQLASVRVMLPHPGAMEAVARLRDGERTLAAVLRLDMSTGHWLCTAFDVLERGGQCLH